MKTKEVKSNTNSQIALIKESTDKQIKSVDTKTDHLIDCFDISNKKIDTVQELVLCVTDSVESPHSKISDNINKLTEVNTRVDQTGMIL